MTPNDMIRLLRQHIADEQAVNWPNDVELFAFLDRACDTVSQKAITDGDCSMLRSVTATEEEQPLPEGFVRFAGIVPVAIVGTDYISYEGEMQALCWCKYPLPSTLDSVEAVPYSRETALQIVDIARILAQSKNEFDVSQDLNILAMSNKTESTAKKGWR